MEVIPVIDLMDDGVVRGVGGVRENYRPIESVLTKSTRPGEVAAAFVGAFSASEIYIADLNALAGQEPNWSAYQAVAQSSARLLIDAGVAHLEKLSTFLGDRSHPGSVVIGLESIDSPAQLHEAFAQVPGADAVFSLDLREGSLMNCSPGWTGISAREAAVFAIEEVGFRRMIVLDVARVGSDAGPTTLPLNVGESLSSERCKFISGGGVRTLNDLRQLHEQGYAQALVASALHDGRLTANDLRQVSNW